MSFLLDMKTIFIILVVGHLFTVLLISAYWRKHKNDKTLTTFFIAKSVQAIAWFFLVLRGGIPDIFTISLANTLLYIGASLETIAVLKLLNHFYQSTKKLYFIVTILNIIVFHLVLILHNIESLRITVASIGTAMFIIIPAYRLIKNNSSPLTTIMGYLYSLVVISLVFRGLTASFSNNAMGLFTPGFSQTVAFLALYLTMILGNIGFILLLKEQADHELVKMAHFDDLTKTHNRRTFVSNVKEYISNLSNYETPVSLILFDIDYFKQINDQYGHDVGDRVLQHLSSNILQLVKKEQYFGRYGGDEFAIFLPGMDEHQSTEFVKAIQDQILNTTALQFPIKYTLSIGIVTVIPNNQLSYEALYINCDKALYEAKRNGRNQFFRGYFEESKFVI